MSKTNIEGFTPARGKFLIDNSKWKDRYFKNTPEFVKAFPKDYEYGKAENGQTRLIYKHVTQLGRKFTEAFIDETYHFVESYLESFGVDPAPQTAWDDCFCEEMFQPVVDVSKFSHKFNQPVAQKVMESSKWFKRRFKTTETLISLSDVYLPSLLFASLQQYKDFVTLETVLDRVYDNSSENWIKLMTDLFTDAKGNLVYSLDLFDQRFNERMFIKPPNSKPDPVPRKKTMLSNHPELSHEAAVSIVNSSCWGKRIFKNVSALQSLGLYTGLHANLRSHLPHTSTSKETLIEVFDGIMRNYPATWHNIVSELSWDTVNDINRFTGFQFDRAFQEDMFVPLTKVQDSDALEEIFIDWDQFDEDSPTTVPKFTKTKLISPEKISTPLKIRSKKVSLINTNSLTPLNIKSNGTKAKN